jgi:threonine dehydrogenase-like Zn-dependent dehydrogenase
MRRVVVVGRSPEKMEAAKAVLGDHGFDAVGVFSEAEAHRAIEATKSLFAVVTGGSVDESARERLREFAATRGGVVVTANIGHDDPATHFRQRVVPQLKAVEKELHQGN